MYPAPRHGVLPMTRRRRRIRTDDPCDQCTVRCCTFCCIGCVAVLLALYLVLTSFLDMEAFAPIELVEFESLRTLTEISKRSGPAIDTEVRSSAGPRAEVEAEMYPRSVRVLAVRTQQCDCLIIEPVASYPREREHCAHRCVQERSIAEVPRHVLYWASCDVEVSRGHIGV